MKLKYAADNAAIENIAEVGPTKTISGTYVRALCGAFAVASLMLSGKAFACNATPEIDPGMATGGLAVLGVGIVLLIERYRAQR